MDRTRNDGSLISVEEDAQQMLEDARQMRLDGDTEEEEEESTLAARVDRLLSAHIE